MITAIVIPADTTQPIRTADINRADIDTYRRLVGGYLEAVTLEQPPATLYVNEEGKLLGLPINPRATALAWEHNRMLCGRDILVGDVMLVGPTDRHGNDTTAPPVYLDTLVIDQSR